MWFCVVLYALVIYKTVASTALEDKTLTFLNGQQNVNTYCAVSNTTAHLSCILCRCKEIGRLQPILFLLPNSSLEQHTQLAGQTKATSHTPVTQLNPSQPQDNYPQYMCTTYLNFLLRTKAPFCLPTLGGLAILISDSGTIW